MTELNENLNSRLSENIERSYDDVAKNHINLILRSDRQEVEGEPAPQDIEAETEEDVSDVLLLDREPTREEQEAIVEQSAGQPAFETPEEASKFKEAIADPELKRKIFKPGEHSDKGAEDPVSFVKGMTREEKFGAIRPEPGFEIPDFDTGGFLAGGLTSQESEEAVEFFEQISVGAGSDIIVNTLTLASEGGKAIRNTAIPGARFPSGKPFTVQDALDVFGIGGKIKVDAKKLEKSGSVGTDMSRAMVAFFATMAVTKTATGAGPMVSGAVADLVASDRDTNFSTMVNQMEVLKPGIAQDIVDYLDNQKTDSQIKSSINNVIEGAGIGGVGNAVFKALQEFKNAGIKPILNERGAIEIPGSGGKKGPTRPAPGEIDLQELSKFVDVSGRQIDIKDRYSINWGTQAAPEKSKQLRAALRKVEEDEISASIKAFDNDEQLVKEANRRILENPQLEYEKFLNRNLETDAISPVDVLVSRKIADESSIHLFDLMDAFEKGVPGSEEAFLDHWTLSSFIEAKAQQHSYKASSLLHSYNIDLGDIKIMSPEFKQKMRDLRNDVETIEEIKKAGREKERGGGGGGGGQPRPGAGGGGGGGQPRPGAGGGGGGGQPRPGAGGGRKKKYNTQAIITKIKNTIEDPRELKQAQTTYARIVSYSKASGNAVIEAWINGLLSGISTQTVNVVNNMITALWLIPERAVAAGISKVRRGLTSAEDQGVSFAESVAMTSGMAKGMSSALPLLAKNMKNIATLKDVEVSALQKVENFERKAITAENFGFRKSTALGRFIDGTGEFIRAPGKGLMTFDEYTQAVGQSMELERQATKAAIEAGYNGLAKNSKIDGLTVAEFKSAFLKNPPLSAIKSARDFGQYISFTKDLGSLGKKIQEFRNEHPMITFILPFIRTPANIFKFTGERLPVAIASKKVREELMAGGARADVAMAKITMGTTALFTAAHLGAMGVITGSDSLNPKMKAIRKKLNAKYLPNAVVIFDDNGEPKKYISINRAEPVGAFFAIGAAVGEMIPHLGDHDREGLLSSLAIIFSEQMTNKTFIRGLAEFAAAVTPKGRDTEKAFKNFARSFVPSIVSQTEILISPERTDVKTPDLESNDPVEMLNQNEAFQLADEVIRMYQARIPWLSEMGDNYPLRDYWSKPVVYESAWPVPFVSPVYQATPTNDPVDKEIERLRVPIEQVQNFIMGVQLTRKQFDDYQVLFGEKKYKGKNVKEAMLSLINSKMYKNKGTDGTPEFQGSRSKFIKMIEQAYKQQAQLNMFKKYPELKEAVKARLKRQAQALGDQGALEKQREIFSPDSLGGFTDSISGFSESKGAISSFLGGSTTLPQ